jgi:predicted RNA-binding protein with RPS1 domain
VHVSELSHEGDDWQELYPVGRKIKAQIIHLDNHDRKVSLSERGADEVVEGKPGKPVKPQQSSSARLGDVMGDLGRKLAEKGSDEA